MTLGASAVREEQTALTRELLGAFGAVQLGRGTTLSGEVARTRASLAPNGQLAADSALTALTTPGSASRVELRNTSARLSFTASGVTTSATFANPTAPTSAGRIELSGHATLQLTSSTRLLMLALRTADNITGGRRDGALLSLEQQLWRRIRLELGVSGRDARHAARYRRRGAGADARRGQALSAAHAVECGPPERGALPLHPRR